MGYERLVDEATDTWEEIQQPGLAKEGDVLRVAGAPLYYRVRFQGTRDDIPQMTLDAFIPKPKAMLRDEG